MPFRRLSELFEKAETGELMAEEGTLPLRVAAGHLDRPPARLLEGHPSGEMGQELATAVYPGDREHGQIGPFPGQGREFLERPGGEHRIEPAENAFLQALPGRQQGHAPRPSGEIDPRPGLRLPGRQRPAGRLDDFESPQDPLPIAGSQPGRGHRIARFEPTMELRRGEVEGPQATAEVRRYRWDRCEPLEQDLHV